MSMNESERADASGSERRGFYQDVGIGHVMSLKDTPMPIVVGFYAHFSGDIGPYVSSDIWLSLSAARELANALTKAVEHVEKREQVAA